MGPAVDVLKRPRNGATWHSRKGRVAWQRKSGENQRGAGKRRWVGGGSSGGQLRGWELWLGYWLAWEWVIGRAKQQACQPPAVSHRASQRIGTQPNKRWYATRANQPNTQARRQPTNHALTQAVTPRVLKDDCARKCFPTGEVGLSKFKRRARERGVLAIKTMGPRG